MNINWLIVGTYSVNIVLFGLFAVLMRTLLRRQAFNRGNELKTIERSKLR